MTMHAMTQKLTYQPPRNVLVVSFVPVNHGLKDKVALRNTKPLRISKIDCISGKQTLQLQLISFSMICNRHNQQLLRRTIMLCMCRIFGVGCLLDFLTASLHLESLQNSCTRSEDFVSAQGT